MIANMEQSSVVMCIKAVIRSLLSKKTVYNNLGMLTNLLT